MKKNISLATLMHLFYIIWTIKKNKKSIFYWICY